MESNWRTACTSRQMARCGPLIPTPTWCTGVNADGAVALTLGKNDTAGDNTSQDLFNQPNAVGFGANGDVFVSDSYVNSRAVQFTAAGRFVRIFAGRKGSRAGELSAPHGVAVDAGGRVFVADSGNKRIAVLGKNGTFVKHLAPPSRGGVAVTAESTLYAGDVNGGAVTIFRNDELVDASRWMDGRTA